MKRKIIQEIGFTLVEITAVLMITGIVALAAGTGAVKVVEAMVFTRINATTIQKAQFAMKKLAKEFNNISAVNAATANSLTFTSYHAGISGSYTVALSGGTVTFAGDTLTDQVSAFALSYYDTYDGTAQTTWQPSRRIIGIDLSLTGANNVVSQFQARVAPRNLQ
ncbi:MAG: hypothetical protein Q8P24_11450 [Desulfobacterales bacterium]|nr:hypothetical protein [Desulfobacterales bacterium]